VVHDVPLAFEHDADPPVAEPAAHGGDLAHLLADIGMVRRTFSPDRLPSTPISTQARRCETW